MNTLDVLIPCKPFHLGKSRLAPVLPPEAREALCRRLLARTVRRAQTLGGRVVVAGNDPAVKTAAIRAGALAFGEAGRGLNAALASANAALLADGGTTAALLVLPIDLPLAAPALLRRFLAVAGKTAAIAPDRAGKGTNLLLIPAALRREFPFAYGAESAARHIAVFEALGRQIRRVRDRRLAFDLDEPADLEGLSTLS